LKSLGFLSGFEAFCFYPFNTAVSSGRFRRGKPAFIILFAQIMSGDFGKKNDKNGLFVNLGRIRRRSIGIMMKFAARYCFFKRFDAIINTNKIHKNLSKLHVLSTRAQRGRVLRLPIRVGRGPRIAPCRACFWEGKMFSTDVLITRRRRGRPARRPAN
jgi:hypothetical protein